MTSPTPRWIKFLDGLFEGSSVSSEDIFCLILAHLLKLVKLQVIYYIHGCTQSGKSVITSVFANLFGVEIAHLTFNDLAAKPRFIASLLLEKRGVFFPDVRPISRSDKMIDALKRLSGGDVLTTEVKFSGFEKPLKAEMPILITSQFPVQWISDAGFLRSVIPVKTSRFIPFENVDNFLAKQLTDESIWLINRALGMTQQNAEDIVNRITKEKFGSEEMADALSLFLSEKLVFQEEAFTPTSALYLEYEQVCEELGAKPINKMLFVKSLVQTAMIRKGIHLESKRLKSAARGVKGISLNAEKQAPTEKEGLGPPPGVEAS